MVYPSERSHYLLPRRSLTFLFELVKLIYLAILFLGDPLHSSRANYQSLHSVFLSTYLLWSDLSSNNLVPDSLQCPDCRIYCIRGHISVYASQQLLEPVEW